MLRSSNSRLRSLIKYFITLRTKHPRSSLGSCSCRVSSTKGEHVPSMNPTRAYDRLVSNSACMKQSSLYGARPRGVSLKPSRRNHQNISMPLKHSTYLPSWTVSSLPKSSNSAPPSPTLPASLTIPPSCRTSVTYVPNTYQIATHRVC